MDSSIRYDVQQDYIFRETETPRFSAVGPQPAFSIFPKPFTPRTAFVEISRSIAPPPRSFHPKYPKTPEPSAHQRKRIGSELNGATSGYRILGLSMQGLCGARVKSRAIFFPGLNLWSFGKPTVLRFRKHSEHVYRGMSFSSRSNSVFWVSRGAWEITDSLTYKMREYCHLWGRPTYGPFRGHVIQHYKLGSLRFLKPRTPSLAAGDHELCMGQ